MFVVTSATTDLVKYKQTSNGTVTIGKTAHKVSWVEEDDSIAIGQSRGHRLTAATTLEDICAAPLARCILLYPVFINVKKSIKQPTVETVNALLVKRMNVHEFPHGYSDDSSEEEEEEDNNEEEEDDECVEVEAEVDVINEDEEEEEEEDEEEEEEEEDEEVLLTVADDDDGGGDEEEENGPAVDDSDDDCAPIKQPRKRQRRSII